MKKCHYIGKTQGFWFSKVCSRKLDNTSVQTRLYNITDKYNATCYTIICCLYAVLWVPTAPCIPVKICLEFLITPWILKMKQKLLQRHLKFCIQKVAHTLMGITDPRKNLIFQGCTEILVLYLVPSALWCQISQSQA